MQFEMFAKFMEFFALEPDHRPWIGKKVTILGGYSVRIGSLVYEYDWQTDKIRRIK